LKALRYEPEVKLKTGVAVCDRIKFGTGCTKFGRYSVAGYIKYINSII